VIFVISSFIRLVTSRCVMPSDIVSCDVMLCHAMWCHVMLSDVVSFDIISCQCTSSPVILNHFFAYDLVSFHPFIYHRMTYEVTFYVFLVLFLLCRSSWTKSIGWNSWIDWLVNKLLKFVKLLWQKQKQHESSVQNCFLNTFTFCRYFCFPIDNDHLVSVNKYNRIMAKKTF
jgi:hypothetical protein